MKTTRQIVAELLLQVENRDAWSNLALDNQLRKYRLPPRESAFAAALFYGVLERRITLDACIAAHSKSPLDKLSPAVLAALRLSVYQLLYMDGVPDHAAVDQGVELVKGLRKAQAAGFVNGVLRSFLRGGKEIPLPDGPLALRWGVQYSCPAPLVQMWLDSYGEKGALTILKESLGRPPVHIRINTAKTSRDKLGELLAGRGIQVEEHPHLPQCLSLLGHGAVQQLPEYKMGLFHVQDVSSQRCVEALDLGEGMAVLDTCAAPGGKSFTAAQGVGPTGRVLACDLHPHRAALIENQARKMNLRHIETLAADMGTIREDLGTFDRVLCDVPCSGLGVVRRKPEIKYKPLEEFSSLPELQYKILKTASHYCREGGRLVYSTCTLHPGENEAVVERFLAAHPEFVPVGMAGVPGETPGKTLLFEWGGDGFFLAAFEKRR